MPASDPLTDIDMRDDASVDAGHHDARNFVETLKKCMDSGPSLVKATGNQELADNIRGLQQMSHWLTERKYFDAFFCGLVALDVVVVCVEVDSGDETGQFFTATHYFFVTVFTCEVALRLLANPACIFEKLMIYDTSIVVLSIARLIVVKYLEASDDHSAGDVFADMSFLIVLRVARLCRVVRVSRFVRGLYLLRILTTAIIGSFYPLAMAMSLTALTILSFAITLTSLVPETKHDGDVVFYEMVRLHGTVAQSCLTLLEGMSGASDWGSTIAKTLYFAAADFKVASIVALICMFFAYFFVILGLNGLITAIFLEQLFHATDKEEEQESNQDLAEQQQILREFDASFEQQGYGRDDNLTWEGVQKLLKNNPQLQSLLRISMESAEDLFKQLDVNNTGCVSTDVFVFAVFKLRTRSTSVDMLSIDYQQEKALHRIGQLHHGLRIAIAGIQSRLTTLFAMLPGLEAEIEAVRRGVAEVQEYEQILNAKRAERKMLQEGGYNHNGTIEEDEMSTKHMSVEDIRESFALNNRLTELEKLVDALYQEDDSEETYHERVAGTESSLGGVADNIVHSVHLVLQKELEALRSAAAER
eukprot:TRINITY_DN76179_c0_g1_i1.p1 TRINITY_DN76179_c0_g1~~TRINITY_DN76179_c0_g1_i1.p1  ORF type:complete len:641 (-),score=117.71 TRINITY_DN76179_c0_g1_i1:101-1867(-)